MTAPPDSAPTIDLRHVVRSAHPVLVPISAGLLVVACVSLGVTPGLVTALWLAIVTPSLVVFDVRVRRLPNVLVVPGLIAVLVDGVWLSFAAVSFPLAALVTTTIITAAMFLLHLTGGLGMGDVKLSAVLVGCLSLVSPWLAAAAVMLAFFGGGAYAMALILGRRSRQRRRIAFGPVLLFAFWVVIVVHAFSATWVVSLS